MEREVKTRNRSRKVVVDGFNDLEAKILSISYRSIETGRKKNVTVRQVHETMLEDGYIPYTTVMAAMNNMSQKGLLKQGKKGKAYDYSPAMSRKVLAVGLARKYNLLLGTSDVSLAVVDNTGKPIAEDTEASEPVAAC